MQKQMVLNVCYIIIKEMLNLFKICGLDCKIKYTILQPKLSVQPIHIDKKVAIFRGSAKCCKFWPKYPKEKHSATDRIYTY